MRTFILLLPLFWFHGHLQGQWLPQPPPATGILHNVRFLNEDVGWLTGNDDFSSSDSAYIFKTTDAGSTWLPSEVWLGTSYGTLFVLDELRVVYSRTVTDGSDQNELRLTTDGGVSWSTVDTVAEGFYEDIDFIDEQTGFVVGGFECVFSGCDGFIKKTTDGGSSWSVVFDLEDNDFTGVSFVTPLEGWASVYWNQLYSTYDGGLTWTRDTSYSPPNTPTRDVVFTSSDSGWTVGGISGDQTISRTTDGGLSWSYYESSLCASSLREVQMVTSQVGWVTGSNNCEPYIARTTDGGLSWETQETGFNGFESISMVNENYGWACGEQGNLYRTSNGGVTWAEGESEGPLEFLLHQNYPNPFNPSTTIGFSLSRSGEVNLKIFNVLGEDVATLVEGQLDAGTHNVEWDAAGHPTGTYFYRLRARYPDGGSARSYVETKKMQLVK